MNTSPTLTSSLAKLLLNSWSAEYALNIAPLPGNEEKSLTWQFPQGYYAGLFSARALLVCTGSHVTKEAEVVHQMSIEASTGLYGPDYTFLDNPYRNAERLRITSASNPRAPHATPADVYHAQLVEQTGFLQLCHERAIQSHIGRDAYADILAGLPEYLHNAPVIDRFATLTTLPIC